MSISSATLAGVPLLDFEDEGWQFTQGVAPCSRLFEVANADAAKILAASVPPAEVTLVFERNGKTQNVRALSVLQVAPSSHPGRTALLVADRRWKLGNKLIIRDFNIRRRSGQYRLVDGVMQRIDPVADQTFAKYSLETETRQWSTEHALGDVLNEAFEGRYSLLGADFSEAIPIDGLMLRDPGDSAIERVLGYVPTLALWMDEDGIAQITARSGGGEAGEVAKSGPPLAGAPRHAYVNRSRLRPVAIDVYFQPEDEVRFDFLDGIAPTTTSTTEPRVAQNVIRLPDTVKINGKVVAKNTWVEINQALFDGWAADPGPPSINVDGRQTILPPLSFETVRRYWLQPGRYVALFEANGDGTRIWARRFAALLTHFRQTYRISRRWADRSHSFRTDRVAIVDPENATRAPSDVYSDHAIIPPRQRIAYSSGKDAAWNYFAWPVGAAAADRTIENGKLCESVELSVADPQEFIFHATYAAHGAAINNAEQVVPSALACLETGEGPMPSQDPRNALALSLLQNGRLSGYHRFTTIITLAPASQGLGGLYRVTVTPEEAAAKLPPSVSSRMTECAGPRMSIYVGPGVTTARFVWLDGSALEIESAIQLGTPRDPSRLIDREYIRDVAVSAAASMYSALVDRWEGHLVTDFDPDRKPLGRISSVIHKLDTRGVFTTELDMSPDAGGINFEALLRESTRNELFRKVQK